MKKNALIVLLALLFVPVVSHAQGLGSIVGTVTDPSGAAVAPAISELPLNGRNAAQLTLLVAGAVNSPHGGADQGATKTFPGAVTYSANGARQDTIQVIGKNDRVTGRYEYDWFTKAFF